MNICSSCGQAKPASAQSLVPSGTETATPAPMVKPPTMDLRTIVIWLIMALLQHYMK